MKCSTRSCHVSQLNSLSGQNKNYNVCNEGGSLVRKKNSICHVHHLLYTTAMSTLELVAPSLSAQLPLFLIQQGLVYDQTYLPIYLVIHYGSTHNIIFIGYTYPYYNR